jgi:hypothetical protein
MSYHIDPHRSACLCDAGSADYLLATVVAEDGSTKFVLALQEAIGDEDALVATTTPDATHEQLGPLPDRWRWRIQTAAYRCGRRTKTTGRPCRITVDKPGQPCGLHRTKASR